MVDPHASDALVPPLAADFATPSLQTWLGLTERALKGRSIESLTSETADGIAYGPLHTVYEGAVSARAERADPDPQRPWDARTLVAHPSPEAANAQALEDLDQGAVSVLLRLESSAVAGIACTDEETLARVLDGVQMELAPVALSAPSHDLEAASWLSRVARRGPAARLAFHIDPLGAFVRVGAGPDMDARMTQAGRVAVDMLETHPLSSAFLASGQLVHEAGGTEAQELGFAAACAIAYARAAAAAGMSDDRAIASVVLGCAADPKTFLCIAKVRALRLIGARLANVCGYAGAVSIEARAGERTLSKLDPWTNLLRLTAAASGAVLGGADAIVVPPFTTPMCQDGDSTDDRFARRQARNVHLVLMEEAHLGRVADPAGGSWFLEHLSLGLARAGWGVMQDIERAGGALAVLREGTFVADVHHAHDALRQAYADGSNVLIGASEHRAIAEIAPAIEMVASRPSPAPPVATERCAALAPWRAAALFENRS